ncbi:hypothetical protein OG21DRAFT_1521184 [Imleria badia]|nr:hypothetical protein OG21DRAFT_1521184 [Imleria badia]
MAEGRVVGGDGLRHYAEVSWYVGVGRNFGNGDGCVMVGWWSVGVGWGVGIGEGVGRYVGVKGVPLYKKTETVGRGEVGVGVGFVGRGQRSESSDARGFWGGRHMMCAEQTSLMWWCWQSGKVAMVWRSMRDVVTVWLVEASVPTLGNEARMDVVQHMQTSADEMWRIGERENIETGGGEIPPVWCRVSLGGVNEVYTSSSGKGGGQAVADLVTAVGVVRAMMGYWRIGVEFMALLGSVAVSRLVMAKVRYRRMVVEFVASSGLVAVSSMDSSGLRGGEGGGVSVSVGVSVGVGVGVGLQIGNGGGEVVLDGVGLHGGSEENNRRVVQDSGGLGDVVRGSSGKVEVDGVGLRSGGKGDSDIVVDRVGDVVAGRSSLRIGGDGDGDVVGVGDAVGVSGGKGRLERYGVGLGISSDVGGDGGGDVGRVGNAVGVVRAGVGLGDGSDSGENGSFGKHVPKLSFVEVGIAEGKLDVTRERYSGLDSKLGNLSEEGSEVRGFAGKPQYVRCTLGWKREG